RQMGADLTVDYTRERIEDRISGFDLVLDGVGRRVWPASLRILHRGGKLVTLTLPIPDRKSGKLGFFSTTVPPVIGGSARAIVQGKRLMIARVKPRGAELEKITALIDSGKLRPVIERVFPLEQIREAHRVSE